MPTFPESPPTEPVLAVDVREGDVLTYDGQQVTVTANPEGAWYVQDGQHVCGLAIACRAGSARWFLYRRASELLSRIRQSAPD